MPRVDSERFYLSSIQKYGFSPKGVHWISQESQELRFKTILEFLPNSIESLVDAGCGFGDFYLFLQKNQLQVSHYVGIDSLELMCKTATKKTSQKIIHVDILKGKIPYAEYYICSGAMNLLTQFETYLFISQCYKASQKGFIFNILYGDKKSDTYNYCTLKQIQKIAKSLNVKKILYKDRYLNNDITIGFFT